MSYKRVIPRDLFNEAALLKCLGQIYILAENYKHIELVGPISSPFRIVQSMSDGSITIDNVMLLVNRRRINYYRPLNADDSWSLYFMTTCDDVEVFEPHMGKVRFTLGARHLLDIR